ncbi:hypothetical protein [Intestinirhabdus alba]|uniref:Uncharacterized protein n=1 Tax=Intestinirhabdus alba TaxID=2899544 RepID=A0A6L6IIE6_9ENTR|nr:hypothetical protein [Intestinirhabdus alba]MTH44860.1 hypothetical protein [Intestinirhabdus alba]
MAMRLHHRSIAYRLTPAANRTGAFARARKTFFDKPDAGFSRHAGASADNYFLLAGYFSYILNIKGMTG